MDSNPSPAVRKSRKKNQGVPAKRRRPPSPVANAPSRLRDQGARSGSRATAQAREMAKRHSIYKEALERFDRSPDFLCLLMRRINWLPMYELPNLYPELFKQKPTNAPFAWWKDDAAGHAKRRLVLLRCIELTKPSALGARSRAKQSPRHRGTERKRATKGSGRKTATPKKKKP